MGYSLYRHISPSGKVYVGISKKKPEWRWNHGKGYCCGDQPLFARAISKYGWDNIIHDVLSRNLSEIAAKALEIGLIKYYKEHNISYNITDGGDGYLGNKTNIGKKASEATRRKMSISQSGKHCGKDNPMYGRHDTAPAYGKYGKEHPASKVVYQYDLSGNFIKKWDCISDVTREIGIPVTHITAVCRGKYFTAGRHRWSYEYPYKTNPEEKRRKDLKRERLSSAATIGYLTGRRKKLFGSDNPSYKAKTNNSK